MWKILIIVGLCHLAGFTSARQLLRQADDLLEAVPINDEPIIGVLTQEQSYYLDGKFPGQFSSYIAASYVKFVEGGGARVVPIW